MVPRDYVGRRLRVFRRQLELTQEALAHRARTTAKYISQIEHGHVSPTIGALRRIVEQGLRVTLSDFFAEPGIANDEIAQIRALLAGQTAAVRRRALRLIRVLVED